MSDPKLCACGCGSPVAPGCTWVGRHWCQGKGSRPRRVHRPAPPVACPPAPAPPVPRGLRGSVSVRVPLESLAALDAQQLDAFMAGVGKVIAAGMAPEPAVPHLAPEPGRE
jgi:hypothetical protein